VAILHVKIRFQLARLSRACLCVS